MLPGNVQLTLMMGPVIPVPVSRDIINALNQVEVRRDASGTNGFQLTFSFSSQSSLNELLVLIGGMGPLFRVILLVIVKGTPHVLMDGVVTHQQVSPGGSQTSVNLTGEDLSALMNQIDFTGLFPYPGMSREARVAAILVRYLAFGVIPLIIPSILPEVESPTSRIRGHQGTDLAYLRKLAQEVGYVFFIQPGPAPGASIGYWGPLVKTGPPQPALNVDMDALTNVESISFQFDAQSRTLPVIQIQNEETGIPIPIPIPDITLLNPPLGLVMPPVTKFKMLQTAHMTPIQAALIGVAEASRSADAVSASGTLDVVRYGGILHTNALVGVRGVGLAYDGLYFVQSVTHSIQKGEYKQNFSLTRNGLVSITPRVPV